MTCCESLPPQAALSIFGMIIGPLLGLYLLGIFFRCANSTVRTFFCFLHHATSTAIVSRPLSHKEKVLIALLTLNKINVFLQGGLVGLISGLVITLWVGIGAQLYPPLPEKTHRLPLSVEGCIAQMNETTTITPFSSVPPSTAPQLVTTNSCIYIITPVFMCHMILQKKRKLFVTLSLPFKNLGEVSYIYIYIKFKKDSSTKPEKNLVIIKNLKGIIK